VENLPYLAAELAYHFNEKFQLRLTLNWKSIANDDDMAYLVLSDGRDMCTYQSGYDFNNYPMGKIGNREFIGKSVKAYVEFKGVEHRTLESKNSLEARLVK